MTASSNVAGIPTLFLDQGFIFLSRQNLVLRALFIATFHVDVATIHHGLREGVLGRTVYYDESRCADFCIQTAMVGMASKPPFLYCGAKRIYAN